MMNAPTPIMTSTSITTITITTPCIPEILEEDAPLEGVFIALVLFCVPVCPDVFFFPMFDDCVPIDEPGVTTVFVTINTPVVSTTELV